MRFQALLLVAAAVALPAAKALHKDQTGLFDWHKELVGTPEFAVFPRHSKRATILVASEKNVVASISPKSGNIVWRQVLDPEDDIRAFVHDGQYALTVSGTTDLRARLWHTGNGFVTWEHPLTAAIPLSLEESAALPTPSSNFPVQAAFFGGKAADVLVLHSGKSLVALNGDNGGLRWKVELPGDEGTVFSRVAIVAQRIYAIGTEGATSSPTLRVVAIDAQKGVVADDYVPPHPAVRSITEFFTTANSESAFLVWNGEGSWVHLLGKKEDAVSASKALNVHAGDAAITAISLEFESTRPEFLVKAGETSIVLRASGTESTSLKAAYSFDDIPTGQYSVFASTYNDAVIVARIHASSIKDGLTVTVVDATTGTLLGKYPVPHSPSTSGSITKAYLDVYPRRNSPLGFRLYAVSTDGSTRLLKEEGVAWSREESLTNVADAVFLDLPEPSLLSQEHDEL
ncbi:hypothetical protein BDK51DRAFT_26034, partial [Blyttiomyces helicus]